MAREPESTSGRVRNRRWFQFSLKTLAIGVIVCGVLAWLLIALWPTLPRVEAVAIGPGPSVVIDLVARREIDPAAERQTDTTHALLPDNLIGEGKWFLRHKSGYEMHFYDNSPWQELRIDFPDQAVGTLVVTGRVTEIISVTEETLTIPFFPTLATVLTAGFLLVAALIIVYWLRRRHWHRARAECEATCSSAANHGLYEKA